MKPFIKSIALDALQGAVLYIKWHPYQKSIDEAVIHTLNQKILEVITDAR